MLVAGGHGSHVLLKEVLEGLRNMQADTSRLQQENYMLIMSKRKRVMQPTRQMAGLTQFKARHSSVLLPVI
jgi:hypothetical protein